MPRCPYEALGVPPSATDQEVKAAYRAAAKRLHPDVAGPSAEADAAFKELSAAYDMLKDPWRRRQYDTARREAGHGTHPGGFATPRRSADAYAEWQAQERAWAYERGGAGARRDRAARQYARTSTARYEAAGRVLRGAWVAQPHVTRHDLAFLAAVAFASAGAAAALLPSGGARPPPRPAIQQGGGAPSPGATREGGPVT